MKILKLSDEHKQKIIELLEQKIDGAQTLKEIEALKIPVMGDISQIKAPTVLYTPEAFLKMRSLITTCKVEIQWHALVTRDEEANNFLVEDILMYHQYVSRALVDTDDERYASWVIEQMADRERFKKIRYHGHSHVTGGVTPSSIDDKYQSDLTLNVQDFYIFAIGNKQGDLIHIIYDVKNNILYERSDVTWDILLGDTSVAHWGKEMVQTYTRPFPEKQEPEKKSETAVGTKSSISATKGSEFEHIGFPANQLEGQIDWSEFKYGPQ